MKIGWIGLGNMGRPMVKHLLTAGFEVQVYNRTTATAIDFAKETGVKVAGSLQAVVQNVECVVTMVADDAALQAIWDEILAGPSLPAGLLAIDMSTVSPDTTKALAARVAQHGIAYMDAPVSGSAKVAEDKQLVIVAGGHPADYEKAKPLFDNLGKLSALLGPHGAGNYAKLAINAFMGITVQGLAEVVIFARKHGIGADQLLPLINAGSMGSPITKAKTPVIIEENFVSPHVIKFLAKDIRIARKQGLDTPVGIAMGDSLDAAEQSGLGDSDLMAILKYLS